MIKIETEFDGLIGILPQVWKDNRGYFFEAYQKDKFKELGIDTDFIQDNQSFSKKDVVRGLHLQTDPHAQAKLVRVIKGKVLDIVVDLRKGSKTFGKHYKCILSDEKRNLLFVPRGFAHGFTALEDTIFEYKCDNIYHKESEKGIIWNDPTLNIDWEVTSPIISDKDLSLQTFEEFIKEY
ncbi:MAG: dTDP-4-dehydrorhamnose 3,5-epimerase [Cyclobacteriaceae bacterium]|nr:dTDP-4-dehydrorhamnose 3,5-epimerase [Cyclobacteriaceae bacterium]